VRQVVQRRKTGNRADVGHATVVARTRPAGARAIASCSRGKKRKTPWAASREKLRAKHADARVCHAGNAGRFDHAIAQRKVTVRMMVGIRYQHEPRQFVRPDLEPSEVDVGERVAVDNEEWRRPSSGSALKMPPPTSSAPVLSSL